MKTKIRRFSKSVLSVILAMTLIMSTMLIGTISVNASVTTLYVTGDAASGWGSWTQLSSKTADKTIAYTTIKGNNNFKVSIAESYDQYNGISLDNSLGDVTISGSLGSGNLSTSNTNSTIYICVRLEDGHIYASTTEPSSGGSESNTELYVLSKYSSDVKLYTYSRNNFTPKDSSLTNNDHLPMNMVASFQNGSNTYYLWKVSYTGTCKFIVYCKSDSESGNWYDKKLTNDVNGSSYTTTSYYFDLKDVDKTNSPTVSSATTTPFKSLESAEFSSAATSFEAGVVNLTTEFPVASATNTLSAYNTVSYYVDDSLVSDPTSWNATAGNHSVYAVINSGTKSGETGAYQSAQTDTKNFTVTSATTPLTTPEIAWQDGDDGNIPPSGSQTLRVTNTSAYSAVAAGVTYTLSDGTTSTDGVFTVTEAGNYTVTVSTTDSAYTTSEASNQLTASAITAMYALEGSITSGGWNGTYEAGDLISEYDSANTDSKYVFKKTVTINASKHFRLITSNNTMYKPVETSDGKNYDVSGSYSYLTKKETTSTGASNGAFYISSAGTYTIYVDQSKTTPSVWVVSESTSHSITDKTTDTNGTVTLNNTSAYKDEVVSFDVTPNTGYEIGTVTISGVTTPDPSVSGNTSTYTFAMPDSDVEITVTFTAITYTITNSTTDTNGTVTLNNTSATVGTSVSFDVTPNTGYKIDTVTISGVTTPDPSVSGNTSTYTFTMPASNVEITVTFAVIKYTVTAGTCTGGNVTVGGSISSVEVASGTQIPVVATAAENYEFVSWNAVDGVTFSDSSSATTMATITKNATITATFKSTSTEPTEKFYLEYWDGSNHQFIPYTSYADGLFTWETKFDFGSFSSDGKFRLTNTTTWTDGSESSFCVPAYKRSNQKGTETYVTVTAVGASVETDSLKIDDGTGSYGVSKYNDIKLNGIDTSKTYIVTYKPVKSNSLDGQITIADKSVTPTLATPKIKGDSSALPGSTITVALDNQKDFGTDEDGDKVYKANDDSLTFTYTVTASDGSAPEVTSTASGKIAKSDGTAINDKISFTASSDNGVTYTITCKVSANGFDDVTSSKLTVKVGTIPYAQADRIYAYAKTLGVDETPALNAWVASESKVGAINTHNDSTDGKSTPEGNKVKPTLGKTTDTDIRIFLPTTASSSKVVLYNSFSTSITVNGTEIQSGKYAEVSYTPNKEYTISNGKKLTIYKSTADGALYVNNTGDYASIDDNGALSMINKLYSDKEKGEIAAGNAGALADSNGVKDVAVKKIKGRGNSTWVSANKKSFNVTFTDNINAFGFKQGKKFSLLANFKDPSLSRNKILYELADLMGVKYSPDAATVDLYMNGLYMGSYLMCQKVDVGSKELVNDLGKTLLEDLYTDSASGKVPESAAETIKSSGFSFLMELDSNAGTGDFYTTVDTQKITIKEPEYLNDDGSIPTDAVTKAAQEFVQTKYAELNTAMSNTSITLEDLNKIIDVESLVKYYLINEIAKNYDIGVSSTYLVYNYTKGKFYISPLWDMDVTTGNCKVTDTNYQSYEGNWTDNTNEGTGNKFMALVFNNPQVQSAARKLWTGSYYTTLTNYIDTLTTKATSVEGSLNCNYTKWNYPYGFQGKYSDNVQALTSLNVATYNPSDNTYTVASSSTSYETTAVGQTQYVSDWLKSRVAWMSKKYNTYTIAGLTGWSGDSDKATMTYNGDGTHTYTFTSAADPTYGIKIYTDNGLSDDISAPQNSTHSCIWYDPDVQLIVDTTRGTLTATKGTHNNFGVTVTEASAEAPVYLIYNQKTNTLTLSDTQSTSSNPSVTLSGSAVASEDIKDGTAVTLTAKITPATSNNVVVTGDYTATLYIGDKVVTTKTVTFADDATEETTMNAVFSTYLEGTNQTYKVVVTCNDGEQDRKGTSNTVTYKQTGVKDQKIYFDPSTYTDSEANFVWLEKTTKDSTVTVTITDSSSKPLDTFKMYIDSDDIHGLDKGVFRGDISEETLAYFKDPSNKITFSMDDTSLTCSVSGQSDITSGWIYNYSSQTEDYQQRWEQYNVAYEESYPGGCTTYAEFKAYLAAQVENNTDNIVYFDNSASKFYNVYIYGWGETGPTKDAVLMKKLPYADIWYYDFESDNVTSNFLFKDRSSYGFGNNYQQTVDLVGNNDSSDHNQCVQNGDGDWVPLNFEATISTPNPIFITQNFYKVTEKNGTGTLKFRAFNTQWDEFADVVASDVQTKAVDIYFDLHDDSATDIQLYHTSTNSKYTFASEFTRLTQMPGSTIYHSTIMLPYTDNGIAFKFDKFVVNYSGGKKTCAMSANVQPTFTCINTGEVWYEINSDFNGVGYDTAVSSASLLKANSPLLTAGSSDKVYFDNSTFKWTNVYVYFYSGAYYSSDKGTGSKTSADSGTCMNASGEGYKMTDPDSDGIFEYSLDGFTGATCIAFTNTSQIGYEFFYGDGVQVVYRGDLATNISSGTTLYTPSNTLNATLNGAVKYYNEGTWSAYDPTPATTDYYVTGTGTLVNAGADWNVKNEGDKLVSNGDGTYSITYTNKDYNSTAGYYAFKITTGAWSGAGGTEYAYGDLDTSSSSGATFSQPTSGTGSGNIQIVFNNQETSDITITFNPSAAYGKKITVAVTKSGSAPTPTISFTPNSISLTLDNGTASATLTPTVTNASGKKVTYSVDNTDGVTLTPSADTLSAAFEVTKVGTYVVTAQIEGTTATGQVTITVSEPVTTDYCGVLAYNHSTATFDVTGGGTIANTDVVLTNGYYKNTAGDNTVTTGYTSYDGTTYTVIYALPSTASSGATTSYSSTTSHSNEGTGEGKYSFDGWTKDGVISTESKTLSDSISGIATVAYIANWSEEVMVTYTFTYVYDMYDISQNGKEYHEDGEVTTNSDYKVQVSLSESATKADVIAAYLANAPKISSDYFTYTFDDTNVAITVDLNNHTAEATAKIASVKKYKVTFNNEDGIVSADEYFYQNIVTLTQSAPSGYVTVWKDEKGNTLYVGDSYSFRITRNIIIESESVTSSSLKPATYVNEPTYEFFTSGTTEYVKFKVRVDNVLAGVTPYEYGTLYFFTDGNGVPVDSTISVDSNIDSDKLTAAALGSASTGIKKYDATDIVNADHKFIYAPYIKNTAANRDRYLRVYSYYIYKDKEGNDVVVISSDSVLASIRNALNES